MPTDIGSTFVIVLSFAVTFIAARMLSRSFRAKRKEKQEAKAEAQRRATETRQVRRARERRGK
jgi:flagellar biosynthesis/type III secretory pathway M-ring protein FliF/YscJ